MTYIPGTFDREHGVLVWGGSLPGGEQWSNSLRVAETGNTVLADDTAGWDVQELLDHYTTVIKAHHANSAAIIDARCMLNFVKLNRVDIHGRYVDPVTYQNIFADISGGSNVAHHPNQICLVISLLTDVTRGPAHRGRYYAPMPSITIDADGRIGQATADGLADTYGAFISALNDTPGLDTVSDPDVCVMSRKSGAAATHRVSGVAVGRVLDTQRRRRNKQVEAYETAVVSL